MNKPILYMMIKKTLLPLFLLFSLFAFAQEKSAGEAAPVPKTADESRAVPVKFREISLGMDLAALKEALAKDELFSFRGDSDVSFLPAREENLVETTGTGFLRRAFFQLKDSKVFIMGFMLNTDTIDHYSVFTGFVKKYGEPKSLSPVEAVWEDGKTRVSIERPLTIKYIDMTVFNAIVGETKTEESHELFRRQNFLDSF